MSQLDDYAPLRTFFEEENYNFNMQTDFGLWCHKEKFKKIIHSDINELITTLIPFPIDESYRQTSTRLQKWANDTLEFGPTPVKDWNVYEDKMKLEEDFNDVFQYKSNCNFIRKSIKDSKLSFYPAIYEVYEKNINSVIDDEDVKFF